MSLPRRSAVARLLVWMLFVLGGSWAWGQNSSLIYEDLPLGQPQLALQQGSWLYQPVPPPEKVELHDTVVVRVDELARVQSDGEVERRKNELYDAVLNDWLRLVGLKAAKPQVQADGDQRVRGQVQQLFRAEAALETRESLAFNIACWVVEVRPNGTLVLEGHKQIRINNESWEVSLVGECSPLAVGPDNVVLSRDIANLKIDKRERGHVRDGYKRGWLVRWLDEFNPF